MYKIPAVIFAGGKSSRMGEDKAALPFAGVSSLSQYQYQRLGKLFSAVYLCAKSDKFDFPCQFIKDRYEAHSPLVALVSLFESLQEDTVFVLSVDAPFVDAKIIDALLAGDTPQTDVVIARSPQGLEPLCALYKRSILPVAKKQLALEKHKLTDLLDLLHCKVIRFEEEKAFLNLNNPLEYQEALQLL